jgi:hypothetical protein
MSDYAKTFLDQKVFFLKRFSKMSNPPSKEIEKD